MKTFLFSQFPKIWLKHEILNPIYPMKDRRVGQFCLILVILSLLRRAVILDLPGGPIN